MGAGDYPAGDGPAGLDPVQSVDARSGARAPAALRFDAETREFLIDESTEEYANFLESHPVDQGMSLSLLVRRGDVPAVPELGNELHRVTGTKSTLAAQINRYVMNAYPLRDLVLAREIEVTSVQYSWSAIGRLIVRVDYRNLVTGKTRQVLNG
jgi:hypothetical protein